MSKSNDSYVRIREIKVEDWESIVALFKEIAHHVNAKNYASEQLLVCAPQ